MILHRGGRFPFKGGGGIRCDVRGVYFCPRARAAKLPRSGCGALRGKTAAVDVDALRGKTAAVGLFSRAVEFVNSVAVVFVR